MIAAAGLASGHLTLADWLFLIAAILFAVSAVLAALQRPDPSHGFLVPAGLCLTVVALFVL